MTDQTEHDYSKCERYCDSRDNLVLKNTLFICHGAGEKFKIRRGSTCTNKNIIYLAYCKQSSKQGVRSSIEWKPRLRNYTSHVQKTKPCLQHY